MIKVGVTGGIGSGKSLVCQVFSKLGVPVYTADDAAKILMDSDPEIRNGLIRIFGESIFAGGKLDRSMLAGLIFDDPALLAGVNRIVHPRVANHFYQWCSTFTHIPFVIHESAILFESDAYKGFDRIILVTAPEEMRIQRVLERSGMSEVKIQRIIKNQLPEEEKIVRSHFVLKNDGTTLLLPQIISIYNLLSKNEI